MNVPAEGTIVFSILILAILAYHLVDRVLEHREFMVDPTCPDCGDEMHCTACEKAAEAEQAALDNTKK